MTTNRIGVWLVTHVSRTGGSPSYWFVAARTSSKATSIVHLKKARPYDELYSALVRWDEKVYPHSEWSPGLEGILGDLESFGPGKTRPCPQCNGQGVVRHKTGQDFQDYETRQCGVCSGTGVRARKLQGTPTHRK